MEVCLIPRLGLFLRVHGPGRDWAELGRPPRHWGDIWLRSPIALPLAIRLASGAVRHLSFYVWRDL